MHSILSFLEQLEANNTTERMHTHQPEYKTAKQAALELAQYCINQIEQFDATINDLEPKDTLFRQAKDIRFSKDKSPYKTNMGIVIAPGGKKSIFPCYYIHLQPGNRSFLAGGLHCPEPNIQAAIREQLDTKHLSFTDIIENEQFKNTRGTLHGDAYKKAPRGYESTHPAIELIKQKERLFMHPLSDKEVLEKNFSEKTIAAFKLLYPFNYRLREAIIIHMKNR